MIRHGLAYDVIGTGEPLLMINGIGAARESWSRQIGDLSARFRCITFDNRGVGESIVPAGPYTAREMADDAARVLSAAGVGRARVLGVSMGGAVAQELAINHPHLVERLVIACSFAACDRYLERCFVIMKEMALSEGPKGPGWSLPVQRFLSLIGFTHGDFTQAAAEIDDPRGSRCRGRQGGEGAALRRFRGASRCLPDPRHPRAAGGDRRADPDPRR